MNPNGDLSRCPKHPTQPPFTGFCSACLLERLSAANLPSPSASSSAAPAPAAASEITTETETDTRFTNPRPTRTTLLYLFQLDDMADGSSSAADHIGVHIHSDQLQDPPSLPQAGGDPPLQRKRSLRQSCDWIVCCDTGGDSWLPSRQSWDGSAAAAPPPPSAAQLVLDRRRNKASLSWNQAWDRRVAKPLRGFVNKPAHILLKRSLSESWRYGGEEEDTRRRGSEGAQGRVGIRINGSHSASSAGMDSEISLPDSVHADVHNVRRDSLMKRLYWLGRSRSVH